MVNSVNTADRLDEESAADELAVATAGEIDAILAVLGSKNGKKLPEEAIRAAQRCPREITPRLIELIRNSIETVKAGGKCDSDGHFFAFFLLTEFRVNEALPVILEAVSLPGDSPFDLFGDIVTEVLNRTLAALAGDTLEVIDQLIGDLDCHRYVRGAAARAYLCLVRDGRMTREEAVCRLGAHLAEANANNDADGAESLVLALFDYAPHEVRDEIEKSYQLGLVDKWMIGLRDFDECIAEGESFFQQEIERCSPTGIDDTVAELKMWASFDEEPKAKPSSNFADFAPTSRRPANQGNPRSAAAQPAVVPSPTIRNTERRVGRNEPCPCGSGKKYKKCCARR